MSQELERVYTINLGKALLSQSQHRAVRAINMIKEFARHHMKIETIKIEEELAHQIWSKGVRSPPRKIRVRMSKTDDGYVLVSRYEEVAEAAVTPEKESKKVLTKVKEPSKEAPKKEEPAKESPKKEEPAKEAPKKEPSKKTKKE
jgi:large subunit ribosomal protein L31e